MRLLRLAAYMRRCFHARCFYDKRHRAQREQARVVALSRQVLCGIFAKHFIRGISRFKLLGAHENAYPNVHDRIQGAGAENLSVACVGLLDRRTFCGGGERRRRGLPRRGGSRRPASASRSARRRGGSRARPRGVTCSAPRAVAARAGRPAARSHGACHGAGCAMECWHDGGSATALAAMGMRQGVGPTRVCYRGAQGGLP